MKKFAVIGLGRFGTKLAIALNMSGAEVIAIDKDRVLIDNMRDHVTLAVRLDSTDEDALKAQGIDKVDVAIVGIGQTHGGFEAAILTVVNLKNMGISTIYARAETLVAGQIFNAVGATDVIYPEIESAQRWAYKLIAPKISEKIDFSPGYSLAKIHAPANFDGKTIKELQFRQNFKVNLVLITRGERGRKLKEEKSNIVNIPLPETIIYEGDTLMAVGSDADLAKVGQE